MKNFPKQRLSFKEKSKDNYKWAKDCIDVLLIDHTKDVTSDRNTSEYERMLSNYQLFNNILNQKDLERECNPYGLEVGQYRDEVQPYNKTYNKIQTLLEEEARMPFKYKVALVDDEGIRSKLVFRDEMIKNYIYAQIDATLNTLGMQLPPDSFDPSTVIDPSKIDEYMSTKYLHAKEIAASKLLNYLEKSLALKELKNDAFKHALIAGKEFVYVGTRNGEPFVEILNPLGVFYQKSGEAKYIQDSMYAGYRTYMTTGDVLDIFGKEMNEEDLKKIDENYQFGFSYSENTTHPDMRYYHHNYHYDQLSQYTPSSYGGDEQPINTWLVQHVEWKSQKQVGFISYINEYGDQEEDIVSEDFEVPKYATKGTIIRSNNKFTTYNWTDPRTGTITSFEWGWIPEVWEGTRIGQDIYTNVGPKKYQFRSLDNPYKVQLGYHGLVYNAMNAAPVSLMDRMKPFQYLYFIIMHRLKKLISQDKGKVFHFDISMVDPKVGLEKTLYYLTNLNIDFYNPLMNTDQPGWSQRAKVSSATDMSSAQHVLSYINMLAAIDQQISDVAGVSRGREGQIAPNEAVTNAQANNAYSAVVTGTYFQSHNHNWCKILDSLLNIAQTCYKHKNVTKQWILDDLSIAVLELNPDSITNASFGVFVTDSIKEEEVFQTLRGLMQALVQNDKASFSDLITTLKSDSIAELSNKIRSSEEKAQQREAEMQQMQLQAQQEMQQAQQEYELEKQARDHENKILIAEIQSFSRQMDQDSDDNGIPDQFEVEKFKTETKLAERKLDIEEMKAKAAMAKSKNKQ